MELLRSPRNKIIAASALLLVLSLSALAKGLDAAAISRWVLALAAAAGGLLWYRKSQATKGRFPAPARLNVVSRAGLTQRCGVALVEADGRSYLVVHGEGFAEVCEAPAGVPAPQGRRPPRRPRVSRVRGGGR